MILYLVKALYFKTYGELYQRGEILLPEQIRTPQVKVSDGKILKIDTQDPRWQARVNNFSMRVGIQFLPSVKASIEKIEREEALIREAEEAAALAQRQAEELEAAALLQKAEEEAQAQAEEAKKEEEALALAAAIVAKEALAKAQKNVDTKTVKAAK